MTDSDQSSQPSDPKSNLGAYAKSGVDIDRGNTFVDFIKSRTKDSGLEEIGSYGCLFPLLDTKIDEPVLVSATDGVGTKLKIAQQTGIHSGIGQDLVAMCVNDLICRGARPLFFLDYIACGKIEPQYLQVVMDSIIKACNLANMKLIGGETAEMPGFYEHRVYDLAGFAVGIVPKSEILPKKDEIESEDLLVGLPSNGFHSNGFSLIRKICADFEIDWNSKSPFSEISLAEELLKPTKIYVSALEKLKGRIKAAAHITGGGITENLPRVLPKNLSASIELGCWPIQPCFSWIQNLGQISQTEMLRVFNCGIGMILVVKPSKLEEVQEILTKEGQESWLIGSLYELQEGQETVSYVDC